MVQAGLTWLQQLTVSVLKCGPTPRHVAFIMDGHRRFAEERGVEKIEGHSYGMNRLVLIWRWCAALGVKELTFYIFSIENFKRTKKEVAELMDLFRVLIPGWRDEAIRRNARMNVIGNLDLLPEDLRISCAESMIDTRDNEDFTLNIALSYTSRDEITTAVRKAIGGIKDELLELTDLDEQLLSYCMFINPDNNPDVLVRTSGETRLSDYLIWQAKSTMMNFQNVLWPHFDFWHLVTVVFQYQMNYRAFNQRSVKEWQHPRVKKFLKELDKERVADLHKILSI